MRPFCRANFKIKIFVDLSSASCGQEEEQKEQNLRPKQTNNFSWDTRTTKGRSEPRIFIRKNIIFSCFFVFFSGRETVKSWMEMFQFKVSLNVFPSFRSGTQYLIFIYVNNNKGGTKTSFETEFYRNWVSQKFRLDCLKIVWCSHERVHRNFQNISVLPFVFQRNPNLLLLSRRKSPISKIINLHVLKVLTNTGIIFSQWSQTFNDQWYLL